MSDSKVLMVFSEDEVVGELRLVQGDRYEFQYQDSWLENKKAFPISIALKLQQKPYEHVVTKSFFEGLIPEEDFLRQLEMRSDIPIHTAFDFLAAYGRDCAGALTLHNPNQQIEIKNELKKISWSELSRAFVEKKTLADVVLNEQGGFFSLAGAQDKIPLVKINDEYYIPQGDTPSTHIIKPPNRYHESLNSVYNEHFCMRLAASVKLNVPETQIIEDEISFYVITRYDRKLSGDNVSRLHQQDFCQAAGILSSQKYEILGGPSLKDNYQMIVNNSAEVIRDSKSYLKWIFFNLLIGNNDSHSKNLSFLMHGQDIILSPFYDLLCTAVYPNVRNNSHPRGARAVS
ncbi:MAG: HipA domain-containing protein [Pseudobdellovibrio sp.]